jgi:hypothetical protein
VANPGGAADASSPDERAALIRLAELPRSSFALDPEYWVQVETERERLERLIRSDPGRYLAVLDELLWIPADLEQLEQARRGEMPERGDNWFRQTGLLLSLLPSFGDEAAPVLRRCHLESVALARLADSNLNERRRSLVLALGTAQEETNLQLARHASDQRNVAHMLVVHTYRVASKIGTADLVDTAIEDVLTASDYGVAKGEAALDYLVSLRDTHPEVNARLLLLPMQMPEGRGDYAEQEFREKVIATSRESMPK